MCFPRVLAYDRLRARYETFANCGAVAGALARMEEQRPWWQPGPDEEILLRPGTRPVRMLNDAERTRLATHGINPLQSLRAANPQPSAVADARPRRRGQCRRQLAGAAAALAADHVQPRARHALGDVRRTRSPFVAAPRATGGTFLSAACRRGLFGDGPPDAAFKVICDERLNTEEDLRRGPVHMLVGLRVDAAARVSARS